MKRETAKQPPSHLRFALERQKMLEELIAKQGVAKTATFEHLLGTGADLWEDDRDFNNFLDTMNAVRQEKG